MTNVKEIIEISYDDLKLRLSKIEPYLKGRSIEEFIACPSTSRPVAKPIPNRSQERKLLAQELKKIRENLYKAPESAQAGWNIETPLYERMLASEALKWVHEWIKYSINHATIGTCTAARGFGGGSSPPVKRGDPGNIIDPNALLLIPQAYRERVKNNIDPNTLCVIFNNNIVFTNTENLRKVRYDNQQKLIME